MDNYERRRKRKTTHRANLVTTTLLCLVALSALTGCIVLLLQNHSLKTQTMETMAELEQMDPEAVYSEKEAQDMIEKAVDTAVIRNNDEIFGRMRSMLENGDGTAEMIRSFFPDEVVVADSGRYYFFPISDKLLHHSYDKERFVLNEEQELQYVDENEQVISSKGIDVSKYQGDIDWQKVAGDGVEYAFIRMGIRGTTEGKLVEDEQFKDNIEGALDNGVKVGVYFFTQALNEEEAVEEARFVLDAIEPYPVTYPVALDVEHVTSENARTIGLTKEERTRAVVAFCETIKKAGYTPMIYGNLKSFLLMLDMEQLESYPKWFAYYQTPVYFPYAFDVWQYTSEGRVNGIKGKVDLNVGMRDLSMPEG